MAKVIDIVKQMHAVLPKYTSSFSTDLTLTSAVIASPLVTVTTTTPHNLSPTVNHFVNVQGAKLINTITGFTYDSTTSTVEFTTSVEHDLTLGFQDTVEIRGFSNYDGNYKLTDVAEGHLKFSIEGTALPVGTGALLEQRIDDINGLQLVTVTGANTFTYNKTDVASLTVDVSTAKACTKLRIGREVSEERLI